MSLLFLLGKLYLVQRGSDRRLLNTFLNPCQMFSESRWCHIQHWLNLKPVTLLTHCPSSEGECDTIVFVIVVCRTA